MAFYTQRSMLQSPPKYPIPGDGSTLGLQLGTRQPFSHRLPDYMGKTFTAACQFMRIANEITINHLFEDDEVERRRQDLQFAETIYHQLLDWSDRTSLRLTGDESDTDHKGILHMWFHARMLDLFRPLYAEPLRLRTFAYRECTSRDIYVASLNQLKRHVFVFPYRFNCSGRSTWFTLGLLQLTASVVADPMASDSRFWFGVCMAAWARLNQAYLLTIQILRVYAGLGVRHGIYSSDDAENLKQMQNHQSPRVIAADFVLDLNLALKNKQKARMDHLVDDLRKGMNLEGDANNDVTDTQSNK